MSDFYNLVSGGISDDERELLAMFARNLKIRAHLQNTTTNQAVFDAIGCRVDEPKAIAPGEPYFREAIESAQGAYEAYTSAYGVFWAN